MAFFSRIRLSALVIICLATLLSACASSKPDPFAKYKPDDEELVDQNYVPRDDGLPLSPAEEKAFRSLGEIDKDMSQEDTAIVELHFKNFVHERRGTFERFLGRLSRYLPYIEQTFRSRGIPTEIAALAMAESGGNPNAISPAGAAGLWQFMPYTGRKYGLEQNSWIDERRDPFKATYAASDYLLKLHSDFKDWHLAMAAYNAGEGKIGRALEQSGAKNFFDICRLGPTMDEKTRLRQETTDYVPRIIALAKIMRNLEILGFARPSPDSAYNLTSVSIPAGTNLSAFSREVGLTWDEFQSMNPAFRRTASPPTSESTAYVPPEKIGQATAWLQSPDSRSYAGWKEYKIRKGDSFASLGKRFKVTQDSIKEANGISRLPKVGNVIVIPSSSRSADPIMPAMADKSNPATRSSGKYEVQAGDTLFSLAQAWGTDVDSIRLANRMGSASSLRIGQRLSVPGNSKNTPSQRVSSSSPDKRKGQPSAAYTVKAGDTLGGIAAATGVSTQQICYLNDITVNSVLNVGQTLVLKDSGKRSAPQAKKQEEKKTSSSATVSRSTTPPPAKAAAKGGNVTVGAGDTLFSIAKANNTTVDKLRKANGLKDKQVLKVGQKLKLP